MTNQVTWPSPVPSGWHQTELRRLAAAWPSNVDKHSASDERQVRLCNYTDVYKNPAITEKMEFVVATASDDQIDRFRLQVGDVVITKDSETADDIGVPAYVDYEAPDLVCGYHLAIVRPDRKVVAPRFLYWVLESTHIRTQWELLASGVTRVGLRSHDLSRVSLLRPPLKEQRLIADFLDRETAQIDTLIAEQRRLISLLDERRNSLVSHLVGSSAEIRTQLRRVARVIDCAHVTAESVDDDTRFPVASIGECAGEEVDLSGSNYTTESFFDLLRGSDRAPRVGDLLFVRNVSVGLTALVPANLPPFAVGQDTVLIRPRDRLDSRFLRYALLGHQVKAFIAGASVGATFSRVNVSTIRGFPIPVPKLEVQVQVADELDARLQKIHASIASAETLISLSSERRSALITAAVTGQIDVTKAA